VAGKANLTGEHSGLAYMVENVTVDHKGKKLAAVKVNIIQGHVNETADEVLKRQNYKPGKVDEAEDFLIRELADGPKEKKTIEKLAEQGGISPYALRTAREKLKIDTKQTGKGKTRKSMWCLP